MTQVLSAVEFKEKPKNLRRKKETLEEKFGCSVIEWSQEAVSELEKNKKEQVGQIKFRNTSSQLQIPMKERYKGKY